MHDSISAASGARLARCEFTLEDAARLGVDPAALESGSSGLAPLREASDKPSAGVLARAHDAVIDTCKNTRYLHQQRCPFVPAAEEVSKEKHGRTKLTILKSVEVDVHYVQFY